MPDEGQFTLPIEAVDKIVLAWLRETKAECENQPSIHRGDITADKMRIAACDVLIDYLEP